MTSEERAKEAWAYYVALCPHVKPLLCEECFKNCLRAAVIGTRRETLQEAVRVVRRLAADDIEDITDELERMAVEEK